MISNTLDFIQLYIVLLEKSLSQLGGSLTKRQKLWLGFCITSIIFTNNICWKAWERWSGKKYTDSALAKMFRYGNIPWNLLLTASVKNVLKHYGIKNGVLVIDDSDHERSKNTSKIGYVHRIKDKKNDGYYNGQNLIFLILVTDVITIPVGFAFYMPDPAYREWKIKNRILIKQGIKKKNRPSKSKNNKEYKSKLQIALDLLTIFFKFHSEINIKCILADAFYGSSDFVNKASNIHKENKIQVISQIRSNQLIRNKRGLLADVKSHFKTIKPIKKKVIIRGDQEKTVIFSIQNLWVEAHKTKRTIIAIKYSDEKEFRYIIASDMTWEYISIIQAYTLRWLIEVFFQDWKAYEGFCNLAKQQGVEGSSRCVILSLLLDHSLFFHFEQKPCIESKLPLHTIGSLIEKSRLEIVVNAMSSMFGKSDFREEISNIKNVIKEMLPSRKSKKHMSNRGFKKVFIEAA